VIYRSPVATWSSWVIANAFGELVGLGVVFACGFALFRFGGEPRTFLGALLYVVVAALLGAFEGAVVGWAQWRVLRDLFPALGRRAWVAATMVGAVVAWAMGMVPSTVAALHSAAAEAAPVEPPQVVAMLAAAGMGVVGGVVLSFAQWLVLRRHVARAVWWLPANALAWALAMPVIFWLVGATVAESRTLEALGFFLAGLAAAGALAGAVHGVFLLRLYARSHSRYVR